MSSIISQTLIMGLAVFLFLVNIGMADQDEAGDAEDTTAEASDTGTTDTKELSGSEKRAVKDQAIAELVDEYNEAAETELDEVVCERVRITGTRRKIQVCKTKREIVAEKESAQRMLLQRNRASSDPRQSEGLSGN